MNMERGPAADTGPQPVRPTYTDSVAGPGDSHARQDGRANVEVPYPSDTAKTTGNLSFGVVAIVAFVVFIVLYRLLLSKF